MTRTTLFIDRIATLVLAAAMILAGLVGIAWWGGGRPLHLSPQINTASAAYVIQRNWWPWASAAVGVVLVLLGLRWLAAHVKSRRVRRLRLPGSGTGGRLNVDAGRLAGAAADAFGDTVGVRSASGVVERDRGDVVIRLAATIEPLANLDQVARQADQVAADLRRALQRDDVQFRIELRVASRGRSLPRAD